jgi:hypothetical protein
MQLLYDETIGWLKEEGGVIREQFTWLSVDRWELTDHGHLSITLSKGVFMESPDIYFGLTLGSGQRTETGKECIRAQYGCLSKGKALDERFLKGGVDRVRSLVYQGVGDSLTHGEFYYPRGDDGPIKASCWEKDFNTSSQRDILTIPGLRKGVEVVKFCVDKTRSEDLTRCLPNIIQ